MESGVASWLRASTLAERIQHLRATSNPVVTTNKELADNRLRQWRSRLSIGDDASFNERLTGEGLTLPEFQQLLGESPEAIYRRLPQLPDWIQTVNKSFANGNYNDETAAPLNSQVTGFLTIAAPLIQQTRQKLHSHIQVLCAEYEARPFDPATIESILYENLTNKLQMVLGQTLVLELHVARLEGRLTGKTPEDRFHSFVHQLGKRDVALGILQEYPVLARQLVICLEQWLFFSSHFLTHLCADWDMICLNLASQNEVGLLTGLNAQAGDAHNDGKSVMILTFSSGFKLVYKPRPLAAEKHFQELLIWFNKRKVKPGFRTLKILDRHGYGWVQFVESRDCTSLSEVRRFYKRLGGYLALLYVIEATDFHSENIVAAGEHPMLVDLETLFEPHLNHGPNVLEQSWEHSVMRVGILPQRIWAYENQAGVDISGLGADGDQLFPKPMPFWDKTGTDEMQRIRKRTKLRESNNRPALDGNVVSPLNHMEDFITGFTGLYRSLLKYREALLAADGPLAQFADDEIRVILRPTQSYASILYESFHPDLMRDALDRERHFDQLWKLARHYPTQYAAIIPAERYDLWRGDIPLFTSRPGSQDLWTSRKHRISEFFRETALSLVQRRIKQLSESDLQRQTWFIRASFNTLTSIAERPAKTAYQLNKAAAKVTQNKLLEAATAIGKRLETLVIKTGEGDVTWIGLEIKNDLWSLAPSGIDLYSGLPGIALFLAYLGECADEPRYTKLAENTLKTLLRRVDSVKMPESIPIGGYNGWGSIIYTLVQLSALWQRPSLLEEAEKIATFLPSLIEQDKLYDVIGGSAGCIVSLLNLYYLKPSSSVLESALQCGEHLLQQSQELKSGKGWLPHGIETIKVPLTGFSHGCAGIAWALFKLADISGMKRYREAALEAVYYERSLFSLQHNNWPDLREHKVGKEESAPQEPIYAVVWCHGAAGIGLARLHASHYLNDAETKSEVDIAIKSTLQGGFGMGHSLCHGDMGNLDFLLQASQILPDTYLAEKVYQLASGILASASTHGWLCGNPLQVEEPGLMTGLAGIGYQLLRLAEPNRVPSVLTLEPPCPAGSRAIA